MNIRRTLNAADFPTPLPRRVAPYPDEDLLSILRRSASHMGYPDFRWLLRPEGKRWDIDEKEIPLLSAKRDYRILERLLLLSQEELYSHTLHRFALLLEDGDGIQRSPGQESISTNLAQLSSKSRETYFHPLHPRMSLVLTRAGMLRSAVLEDATDFSLSASSGAIAREMPFV